jgi:serine protease AprX
MEIGKWVLVFGGCVFLSLAATAQPNRYMVFFKDKAGTPYTASQPLQFLSQKAIDRRIKQSIEITPQDFPVNANYIQGVKNTGANVFFQSRWFNAVLVQCQESLMQSIISLPFVDHAEFVAPQAKLSNGGRLKISLAKKNGLTGVETQSQLQMIGITDMHEDNKRGEGITIAIFDGGFSGVNVTLPFQPILSEGRINMNVSHDFVHNTKNVFQYDEHGTEVFSVIAAYIPDVYTGGAYKANYQLYVTEDVTSEYRIEEYNWAFAAERADSAGVDIVNSSLGYYDFDLNSMNYTTAQMDGKTATISKAAQWLADRGVIVVCSAGNEGNIPSWRIISAPADAVDVVAVANVNANGVHSSSSSIGPSSDGRIKPDLAALGSGVKVIKANGTISSASGTSLSAPLITSLVAGVWQQYPNLSSKELVQALKNTSSQAQHPDILLGYGIPNYVAVKHYLERLQQTNLFEVFPNPVTDTVTVRPIDPDSISSCRIELISAQGQLIAEAAVAFSWLQDTYKTSLAYLPSGIYYLRVWLGAQRFTYKLVKL